MLQADGTRLTGRRSALWALGAWAFRQAPLPASRSREACLGAAGATLTRAGEGPPVGRR